MTCECGRCVIDGFGWVIDGSRCVIDGFGWVIDGLSTSQGLFLPEQALGHFALAPISVYYTPDGGGSASSARSR